MRYLFALVPMILMSGLALAQTNSDFNSNIGIKVFSYGQTPPLLNQDLKKSEARYASGIILKFNDNQLAYRVAFDWFNKNAYHFSGSDSSSAIGKYTDYAFKIGFEHDLSVSRLKPSFGVDLGFFHSDFSGMQSGGSLPGSHSLSTNKNGLTLSPFAGLKYIIIPRLYISVEASLNFIYSYNRVETSTAITSNVSRYSKAEYLIQPLNFIGLHYNFGSAN